VRHGTTYGRVRVVTGSGRGIGRSVSGLLSQRGRLVWAPTWVVSRDGSGHDAGPSPTRVDSEIAEVGGRRLASLLASPISPLGRLIGTFSRSSACSTCWSRGRPSCRPDGLQHDLH